MLSFQLGGSLAAYTSRVLLIDGDPQRTLIRVAAIARARGVVLPMQLVSLVDTDLSEALARYRSEFDFIIVDTPPNLEAPSFTSSLRLAHLALIPMVPSPPDLWAVVGTVEIVRRVQVENPGLMALIVINRYKKTRICKEVIKQVAGFDVKIADSLIHNRTAYEEAWGMGQTILAMKPRPREAAVEIHALLHEILMSFLNGVTETAS